MKTIVRISTLGILAALFLLTQESFTQEAIVPAFPRISEGASVSQVIGISEVTVSYHRPGVKGRIIWGGLVPYNTVWRSGANEATTVTFSDNVEIEGRKLSAGTYGFFTIPGEKEWTIIFNSQPKQWGAFNYDSTKDVLRFTVTPEAAPFQEWMSYSFTDLTMNSARFVLSWEKLAIGFTIKVDTDAKLASNMKSLVASSWQSLNNYARYCLDNKVHWDDAMQDINKSIALNENYTNLRTKAELLAQGEKYKEAVAVGEKAIEEGKGRTGGEMNVGSLQKLVAEWKKKI
jgi:hypothetical protein